jgi:hypothetical protein
MYAFLLVLVIGEEQKTINLDLKRHYTNPKTPLNSSETLSVNSEDDMKRRGLSILTKTMENYFNLQYFASLYIGTGEQMLTFIYDTGSSYLWVPLNNCTCSYATNKYTINSYTQSGKSP